VSRRSTVVVADACGAGELPDAGDYGDSGANDGRRHAPGLPGRRFA